MTSSDGDYDLGLRTYLEAVVEMLAWLRHGSGFDQLLPDPFNDRAWIVALANGRTETLQVACVEPNLEPNPLARCRSRGRC